MTSQRRIPPLFTYYWRMKCKAITRSWFILEDLLCLQSPVTQVLSKFLQYSYILSTSELWQTLHHQPRMPLFSLTLLPSLFPPHLHKFFPGHLHVLGLRSNSKKTNLHRNTSVDTYLGKNDPFYTCLFYPGGLCDWLFLCLHSC